MIKGSKLISGFLVGVLAAGLVMNVGATNIKDAQNKANKLEQQQNKAKAEKNSLVVRVREISASMKKIEDNLDAKQAEIEATEQELIWAKVNQGIQYESMKLRIRYMYENGKVDFLQLLMESDSITDFLSKTEYITKMSEYDREKLDEYVQTVNAVGEKELALEAEYKDLEKLRTTLTAQKKEAEELLSKKNAELNSISSELQTIRSQIANAENEEQLQQEANNSSSNSSSSTGSSGQQKPVIVGNGYFTHPCPGMSYQSSEFGEIRTSIGDPIPHKGHDYAAPKGTPIYAAAAGTVLIAGYSNSAGNWVVIDHGNGLVTKYMHMYQRPLVRAGQKVVKGQHIGGVGTTGQSTGNHLHFQVELNGNPVNPSKYL